MKRICLVFLILAFAVTAVPAFAQQPAASAFPERDQTTIQDLKDQIADMAISSRSDARWIEKLLTRIQELEKQIAALKAASSKPAPPKE